MVASPTRPNQRGVDDALETKVFQVVTIMVNLTQPHGFAAIIFRMECVWDGDTSVES